MSFKLSSTKLLEKLEEVSSRFSGKRIGSVVKVGPEAAWWYYHEFGTATHQGDLHTELPQSVVMQEPEPTVEGTGYPISAKGGLSSAGGIRLPVTAEHGEAWIGHVVHHPGVPALGLVRAVLPKIHDMAVESIGNALNHGEYSLAVVQEAINIEVIPEVINVIAASIEEKMGKDEVRLDGSVGKLKGVSPSDVFRFSASIEALEE